MQYLNKVKILFVIKEYKNKPCLISWRSSWFTVILKDIHSCQTDVMMYAEALTLNSWLNSCTNYWVTFWSASTHFHFLPPSKTRHTSQASFLFGRYIYSPGYSTYTHTLCLIQRKHASCGPIIHTNVIKQYTKCFW